MFCTNCGSKVSEQAKFCSACGSPRLNAELGTAVDITASNAPVIPDLNCSACNQVSLKFIKNVKSTILLGFSVPIGLVGIYFFLQSRAYPTGTIEDLGFLIFVILAAGINFINKYKVFQCSSCGEYSIKMRFGDVVYPVKLKDIENPIFYI